MDRRYDIFISYRRKWGALYARILQLKLQGKGYKVFLDYDELRDGHFDEKIIDAIRNSTLFVFIYSKDSLVRCSDPKDWVRQEIECAIGLKKQIIPIVPDKEVSECFDGVPQPILDAIGLNEHSEIDYGKALDSSVEDLLKDRIIPHIGKRSPLVRKLVKILALAAVALFSIFLLYSYIDQKAVFLECSDYVSLTSFARSNDRFPSFFVKKAQAQIARYDSLMNPGCYPFNVNFVGTITYPQLVACNSILKNMVWVDGGTFLMGAESSDSDAYPELEMPRLTVSMDDFMIGKYEVSIGEWCGILNQPFIQENENLPVADVTWAECESFVETLFDLTGLKFVIPTEVQWEYAARGGKHPDNTRYSGSDDVKKAAVYEKNSNGHPAIRNYARIVDMLDLESNSLDLYDMSGNVEEWCRDDFRLYSDIRDRKLNPSNNGLKVIRGGSYLSPASDVRITSRGPKNMADRSTSVGLRLVIEDIDN